MVEPPKLKRFNELQSRIEMDHEEGGGWQPLWAIAVVIGLAMVVSWLVVGFNSKSKPAVPDSVQVNETGMFYTQWVNVDGRQVQCVLWKMGSDSSPGSLSCDWDSAKPVE